MKKFLKWMKIEKCLDISEEFINEYETMKYTYIGYMIEYISNHSFWKKKENEKEYECQSRIMMYEMRFRMCVWAKDLYSELKNIIEKIDK